jgi:hypothetical protein
MTNFKYLEGREDGLMGVCWVGIGNQHKSLVRVVEIMAEIPIRHVRKACNKQGISE